MQSTVSAAPAATGPTLSLTPTSLLAAFGQVADPRRQASITYPLAGLLALTVTALLANQQGILAIAEWAARQSAAVLQPLGFTPGQTPYQTTLHRLFAKLDPKSLSTAPQGYFVRSSLGTQTDAESKASPLTARHSAGACRSNQAGVRSMP